jgi:hypothetical protein
VLLNYLKRIAAQQWMPRTPKYFIAGKERKRDFIK